MLHHRERRRCVPCELAGPHERNLESTASADLGHLFILGAEDHPRDSPRGESRLGGVLQEGLTREQTDVLAGNAAGAAASWDQSKDAHQFGRPTIGYAVRRRSAS